MSRYVVVLLSLIVGISIAYAKEPQNLVFSKQQVVRYHDSGEYEYDINQAINKAVFYLGHRIAASQADRKMALVFDIDETCISNYPFIKKNDFAESAAIINRELARTKAQAINATLKLYNFAKKHKIALFLITGRKDLMQQSTIKELHYAGYKGWQKLFMRHKDSYKAPTIKYKTSLRKKITQMGYDIVLNVGDQFSDLAGGYSDYSVKLPNPYYYVP